ncbi:hypothetical protein N9R81_02120 [Flavobacteriales bacterium]|nr:hypothetical protein [Flavobacteriales bacterium]
MRARIKIAIKMYRENGNRKNAYSNFVYWLGFAVKNGMPKFALTITTKFRETLYSVVINVIIEIEHIAQRFSFVQNGYHGGFADFDNGAQKVQRLRTNFRYASNKNHHGAIPAM